VGVTALVVVVVLVGLGGWAYTRLRASLPPRSGTLTTAGIAGAVRIAFDSLGVPTLEGSSRADLAFATGLVHGQDRFFQMDLQRRHPAGELAELLGAAALPEDRRMRLHGFRGVARRALAAAAPAERELLEAYARGVNTGLASLGERPFEYLVLRAAPASWRAEDSVLCVLAMFVNLGSSQIAEESAMGLAHDLLPTALYDLLTPLGDSWDAALDGSTVPAPPLPGPDVIDLRRAAHHDAAALLAAPDEGSPESVGSNNWAMAASRTRDGGAILANDMHLEIRVPNTWYRLSLEWSDGAGAHRVTGASLPGTPAIVAGSNGRVAWGFTNSYADFADLVLVEPSAECARCYRTPAGVRSFERRREVIHVRGAVDDVLDVSDTVWGPIIDTDHQGRQRALRWTAQDPGAVNFTLIGMEAAVTVWEALALGPRSGIPGQNLMVADAGGHIGWTIAGRLPHRVGFDGRVPTSWADGSRRWDGWLEVADYPRIVDPPAGFLWTANQRTVGGAALAALGDGGYHSSARARQVRDDLAVLGPAAERDMLAVQLDNRALFLSRWQKLLLDTLSPTATAASPRRVELRRFVDGWGARAAVDSVGYRAVRAFRDRLTAEVGRWLTAPCRKADPAFRFGLLAMTEDAVWRIVTERPAHLLDPRFANWDEAILASVDATVADLVHGASSLAGASWGARNTARIRHPLSRALPLVAGFLDMPGEPLPGDGWMPRVAGPDMGASERFAVSPGHEERGYFHMPCGQSGHPLSAHYRDGHHAWVAGEPTPFMPGPAASELTLTPAPR
jgi:penicillin amidase